MKLTPGPALLAAAAANGAPAAAGAAPVSSADFELLIERLVLYINMKDLYILLYVFNRI